MIGFDELAASASSRAHASTTEVDVATSFPTFQRAVARRGRSRAIGGAVALALVVGVILWAAQLPDTRRVQPVRPAPSPTAAAGPRLQAGSVGLTVPVAYPSSSVIVRLEPGSSGDVARFSRIPDEGGISIFENVIPVRDKAGHRDTTAGDDARRMAEWLAARPFLVDTRIVPVSIGGLAGWRVESHIPKASEGANTWQPVLRSGKAFVRFGPAVGDVTFVDVPGAGVVAIWAWNPFGDLRTATEPAMRAFVAGLRFGG